MYIFLFATEKYISITLNQKIKIKMSKIKKICQEFDSF